eukprot:8053025-Pyramimonas_sp.AAC.1
MAIDQTSSIMAVVDFTLATGEYMGWRTQSSTPSIGTAAKMFTAASSNLLSRFGLGNPIALITATMEHSAGALL